MHNQEKISEPWSLAVQLIQEAFCSSCIPLCLSQVVCALIPKNKKGAFYGISLLKSVWKAIMAIINHCMAWDIELHDTHHGFHPGCGTGTTIIESNLQIQLACQQGWPYFQVFLDLTKAYNTLDCNHTLGILAAYGVGSNIHHNLVSPKPVFHVKHYVSTIFTTLQDALFALRVKLRIECCN